MSAQAKPGRVIVGVISDTHGLLRPEALAALRGAQYVIHAGDIGDPEILKKLAGVAPATAVRGNVDTEPWTKGIPITNVLHVQDVSIYVVHKIADLDIKPESAGFAAVVYGHSHEPSSKTHNGVLYFNPGSAGPRRFKLPVSVGRLTIRDGRVTGEIIPIL